MPVVKFYLPEETYADAAVRKLLEEASSLYVEVLYPEQNPKPLERVRALVVDIRQSHWATAGEIIDAGGIPAPLFEFLILAGRSDQQVSDLLKGFTQLLVKHLKCSAQNVRGMAVPINPAHWSIGGDPASHVRQDEIIARQLK